jgi:hypothetical protein
MSSPRKPLRGSHPRAHDFTLAAGLNFGDGAIVDTPGVGRYRESIARACLVFGWNRRAVFP